MPQSPHHQQRGSVVLVALCFLAVLGIALASYLAVSSQAMKLSNRAYQQSISAQLAEIGIEQTLWAFNANNWDPSVWTVSGTTAKRTITFPVTKYGNGIVGSINLRVDNYDAYNRPSTWNATSNYRVGDLVGFTDGMWYRCLQSPNLNKTPPNLKYWAPAPIPWAWNSNVSYNTSSPTASGSLVCYGGNWYNCIAAPPVGAPPLTNPTFWQPVPPPSFSWDGSVNYAVDTFVFYGGTWYRCTASNTGNLPSDPAYWSTGTPFCPWAYRSSVSYNFNDVVYYSAGVPGSGTWYRCTTPGAGSPPPSGWENALSGSWAWSSNVSYNLNEVVYYGGSFYRCILAHSNQTPPNSIYWSSAPLLSPCWDPGSQYNTNAVVNYNGSWYLDLGLPNNSGKNPAINDDVVSPYWALAQKSLPVWDSTKNYNINDTVNFGGSWYRCIAPHINQPTTNATYWISINGASYQWDSTATYTTNSYVSYGGVWYSCILANTNQSPNNSTFWTALGAPVIYAEGMAALPDNSASIKTQLRATVAKAPLFPNAAGAVSTLKINAAGTVDSYDGSVYARNSPQDADRSYIYDDQSNAPFSSTNHNVGFSAVLSSLATVNPAITVTNTQVSGYIAVPSSTTPPFAPLWNYGGLTALIGTSTGTGVDLRRVSRSPYIPQFDTQPKPSLSSGFIAADFAEGTALSLAMTMNLGTPGGVTPSRYYYNGILDIGTGYPVTTLNINGPVILFISGRLRVRAGGKIEIKSTGSAEIHCDNFRTYVNGEGISNLTQDPKKLIVLVDSSSSSAIYLENNTGTNKDFCGVFYAPNVTSTLGIEVRTGVRFFGALSAQKITLSSETHYDTSLRYATFGGIDAPFMVTQWRELTDPTEKVVLP